MLISRGNMKLGILPAFSLPPGKTCPGKTLFCERYCFGVKGNFILPGVQKSNELRFEASRRDDFVNLMLRELRKVTLPALRLHVVGDFYNEEYTEKWVEIAREVTPLRIFGSTRSWRVPRIAPAVKCLRDLENVYLRASVDFTDDLSPYEDGWKVWSIENGGEPCPHDKNQLKSCYVCGRCWNEKDSSTSFNLRWRMAGDYWSPSQDGFFLPERRLRRE